MFMYFSGSINYGLNDQSSDYDVTVMVDGFKGNVQINYPNLDLLVFGSDCYMKRLDDVPLYATVKMDDIFNIDSNLIYLNKAYTDEFNDYKNQVFN